MEIEDAGGVIAKVRHAFFSPLRHRYFIDLALAIAVAVCIDRIHEDELRKHQVR